MKLITRPRSAQDVEQVDAEEFDAVYAGLESRWVDGQLEKRVLKGVNGQ